MTCGIYKITRKDTGQMYIGLSENIEKRYREHANGKDMKHSRIDPAMVKHGTDKFNLEIIEELPNDRHLLMKREEYWIAHYNTYGNDFHYNLTPGGDFNPAKLPEVQAKISKSMSGRKLSQKTKEKIAKTKYGSKHTPEAKDKMSQAHLGKKLSDEQKINISKTVNTSGYYCVTKQNKKECKQGFMWRYRYYEDGKHKAIYSVDIKKLEEKVRAKGLKWLKFDE